MLKKFFKNKAIGYYIALGTAVLALIMLIIFFATYNKPDLASVMGNKADSYQPVTIGIFLIAGVVVELVVLVLPEFRFFQLGAIVMFALALYKEILIIPDFIAGIANGVEYNGGNAGLNFFYLVMLFIIAVAAVVAPFLGFEKELVEDEDDEEEEVTE